MKLQANVSTEHTHAVKSNLKMTTRRNEIQPFRAVRMLIVCGQNQTYNHKLPRKLFISANLTRWLTPVKRKRRAQRAGALVAGGGGGETNALWVMGLRVKHEPHSCCMF